MDVETRLRKILFIAWDAPHVNYLEGLFLPIFHKIAQRERIIFYVLHFSWQSEEKSQALLKICEGLGIRYTYQPVSTRIPVWSKYMSQARGASIIRQYVRLHSIDIVMPRSTMPAKMVLSAMRNSGLGKVKVVFDADGLPIEERVDFAGLGKNSLRYRVLKRIEKNMVKKADRILTRSVEAISILKEQHDISRDKFFVVRNGRDPDIFFRRDEGNRLAVRFREGIPEGAWVMVYTGSLGPQYGLSEMFALQRTINKNKDSYLLMLVVNPEFIEKSGLAPPENTVVKKVAFAEVPEYLSASDVGLAIREPSFSMKGVSPIKLGEYLLSGLPVIATSGIGDTQQLLGDNDFAFLLADNGTASLNAAAHWASAIVADEKLSSAAREFGVRFFGLSEAANSYIEALQGL